MARMFWSAVALATPSQVVFLSLASGSKLYVLGSVFSSQRAMGVVLRVDRDRSRSHAAADHAGRRAGPTAAAATPTRAAGDFRQRLLDRLGDLAEQVVKVRLRHVQRLHLDVRGD